MKTVAIYSLKGGVGKTSLAVNVAWLSATRSSRRTLLWDLDAQAASTFILPAPDGGPDDPPVRRDEARAIFARELAPAALVRRTATPGLDLLPADASLRDLDSFFLGLGKKRRLSRLIEQFGRAYDRVLLDCPPGLTQTSEQVLRAADLIIVPVIPAPLSRRALDEVVGFLDAAGGGKRGAILPVFNMVDRRRMMHLAALEAEPRWPVVPMASAVELMAVHREPLFDYAPRSPAAAAIESLWTIVERRLTRDEAAAA